MLGTTSFSDLDGCPAGSPPIPLPVVDCTYYTKSSCTMNSFRVPLLPAEGEALEENENINICMPIGEVDELEDHVLRGEDRNLT